MKYTNLFLLILLSGKLLAQKELPLPAFNKIEVATPMKINLTSGKVNKASHPKSLEGFTFEVKNQVLSIGYHGENSAQSGIVQVDFIELNEIDLNGPVELGMDENSKISGEVFELQSIGVVKVDMQMDVKSLKVESNGASQITLKGSADQVQMEITGASKVNAFELKCKDVKVEAAGASKFQVYASNLLNVEASGASFGEYSGSPVSRNINVSGISHVVDVKTGEEMADERNSGDDTTRISLGKKKLIIIEEGETHRDLDEKGHKQKSSGNQELKSVFAGFEMGLSQFASPNLNFALPKNYEFLECNMGKSWFYGINLMEGDWQIVKNKLAITSGLGMEFQNFKFSSNRILSPNVKTIDADSGLIALSNNKLYNFNFNVPLLIKFAPRTKKERNNFHFAVGVIGTYKAYSHIKIETSALGYEQESTVRDDYNINPFRLTATARIGYGWFRAFANYSLTPYFNTANGNPDIRVFSAGITLIPFH